MDDFFNGFCSCFTLLFQMVVLYQIIGQKQHIDLFLENLIISSFSGILLNTSNKPPACISAVVSGVISIVKQIWNHTMPLS
jgi:hypothetical protein